MPTKHLITLSLATIGLATVSNAASIGLNFVDGRSGLDPQSIGAAESAGVVSQVNWNNTNAEGADVSAGFTRTTLDIASPIADTLVDNTGVDSGATVSWFASSTWSPVSAGTDGDGALMSDFLQPANGTASVTFSDLTYDTYDVYLYFGRGQYANINGDTTADISIGATTKTVTMSGEGTGFAGFVEDVNYVRFSGVTGSSFTASFDHISGSFTAGIKGIQVVAVPEPSTAALLAGCLGLGHVMMRRRRR